MARKSIYPPILRPDHWLSQLIGHQNAQVLGNALTVGIGVRLEVPLGPAGRLAKLREAVTAMMDVMIGEGRSGREITLATGICARTVRRRRQTLTQASTIGGENIRLRDATSMQQTAGNEDE